METKKEMKLELGERKKNLLLTEEPHQRKHIIKGKFSTTRVPSDKSRQKDAWKEIANKINASSSLVVCTQWNTKKVV